MKLFRLDRTDPLSFGPKFPDILVEWIAPVVNTGKPTWYKNLETMLIVLSVCNAGYILLALRKSVKLIVNFIKM